jgi:hypothetical protein
MKKITIILILVTITSCKEKAKEAIKEKTPDEIVKEAAVPYIAREIGELDINVMIARDTTRNETYRGIAIDKIRRDEADYLYPATIENIFSRDFEERLENQKKLITENWRQIERNKQLKQLVIEQFKK